MLKLGISKRGQYRPTSSAFFSKFRHQLTGSRISLQLLRTPAPASPEDLDLFDVLMSRIWLSSGVKRTTKRERFTDLDRCIVDLLQAHYSPDAILDVQDWAASSCITSKEWATLLFDSFPNARLTASDSTLYIVEAITPDGDVFITERSGEPLQFVKPPFVIRLRPPEPKQILVNYLLYRTARTKAARVSKQVRELAEVLDQKDDFTTSELRLRKLSLVHPEAVAMALRDERFSVRRHSAFEPLSTPADIIRSMNIFNLSYFPPEQLLQGVVAVNRSLKEGGLWVIGRSDESSNVHSVSVFQKNGERFELLDRFGSGSEIETLVVDGRARRVN